MTYRDYTDEEIERRGEEIYADNIRLLVEGENKGRYVVINIETGEWRIGDDVLELANELHAGHKEAPLYTLRVGYPFAVTLGGQSVAIGS